ncbi:E3 ubiquitin-protein ligase shprh [Clonorchis sinensis]|uniref:E3 ubiquitin-protein ligase shprh n=1 Tax=Clonorchis sinensis TaxID=79923 RepID=A0A8T1MI61_CLOSI|nr:E3 ubiquitin-protein ligase shprh [Clonorchis sinensis]
MGLGKTLEVIALILLNPWREWQSCGGQLLSLEGLPRNQYDAPTPPLFANGSEHVLCSCGNVEETQDFDLVQCSLCDGPSQHAACVQYEPSKYGQLLPVQHGYVCPQCWAQIRIESKSTLIVAPDHIWQQWKEELQTHLAFKTLGVLLYAGMEAPVTPVELGNRMNTGTLAQSRTNPYAPRTRVTARLSKSTANGEPEVDELLPGFVQPGQLACADIVLTSYSVVQRELDWAEVVAERQAGLGDRPRLRLAQRYLCRPSPLTCVRWWRVCLDEAQMVERVTSKTARMMSRIDAVHRWCITGTPAEKSIDDLYGLFSFLRFEPFSIAHYWHSLLYQPFLSSTAPSWQATMPRVNSMSDPSPSAVSSTMLALMLSQILWRNTKALVGNQLSLPPITEEVHWISFTPVERYIHDRVLAQSAGALQRLSHTLSISPDQPLATFPGTAHWRLVYLITRLRQACTHASLVVGTGPTSRHRQRPTQRGQRLGHGGDTSYGDASHSEEECDPYDPGSTRDRNVKNCDGPSVAAARAHRGCFTMTEVIRRVVDDTRRECEGLLRSWVFNKNGAAGCFIIKQQFDLAADCYRDVLRTANDYEKRHGVLADWSQRLHAITNLHWLIQSRGVPLENLPLPSISVGGSSEDAENELDPRVDRDLLRKAERLRKTYIQMHSRLLARMHDHLAPVVVELDTELGEPLDADELIEKPVISYGSSWLSWLSDAMNFLISCGVGANLVDMLVSSFQGKPGSNRSGFRTTLFHAKSAESFKAMLLSEVMGVFEARKRLQKAMHPLISTWRSFLAGKEADPRILQPFYACCARNAQESEEAESKTSSSFNKKQNKAKELKDLSVSVTRPVQKNTKCAYCIALRALSNYQCALNHERLKAGHRTMVEQLERLDTKDALDESGTGLIMGNPLIVSLSIVCHQIIRTVPSVVQLNSEVSDWPQRAKRFEQLFRQMGKEVLLTSRTVSLTKEWWNIHDDTEQFVVRLQATCSTDLAFIHEHEVDAQLRSYTVDAGLVWPRLQSRLGHFGFLRNAYLTAVTGNDGPAESEDTKKTDRTFRMECPTCLQMHSPKNPTFVLLPGCWHTLCITCHDRIANQGHVVQRRCPVCRAPFQSNETTGFNARRRRPLTLIHYSGETNTASTAADDQDSDGIQFSVVGDHSSKVKAVIRCLKQIKLADPDAKAIVFSSWLSVLVTIAGALEQNGLSYTTLFHPRDACCPGRLTGFHCFGSATWILLMPIQLGSNGLNLTSANHLLLVDPVLSHGREAQAIARMHRIGQTRPGIVHRFLVKDSIEAALHMTHVRAQANSVTSDATWATITSTECMIGAGARRTSSRTSGLAGPGEDRAHLMQMTLGQLADLLRVESNSGMFAEELNWAQPVSPGTD